MDHDTSTIAFWIVAVVGITAVIVATGTAVGAADGEPTATIEYDPSSPTVDEVVTFVANATDPDGTIVEYEWRINGEAVSRSQSFDYQFESSGEHEVALSVTDDDGNTTSTSTVVTVAANEPPTASIEFSPSSPAPGETVDFRADAEDPDGEIAAYQWRINGEPVSRSQSFDYQFEAAGDHDVVLNVTDDDGNTTSTSTLVTVAANEPPTASIEFSPSSPAPGETVGFQADAEDPDGEIATYQWRIDGEVVTEERTDPDFQYTFDTTGEHLVEVVVTDSDGATTVANATVSVVEGTGATFTIAALRTSSPVREGERLSVTATVENEGEQPETRTVTLVVDGEVRDSLEVSLGGGENTTVTLVWETSDGDGGTYTASVRTENESAERDVQVIKPATFTVAVDSTNSPVTLRDRGAHNVEINVTVTNVGDLPGNQTVTLSVGAVKRDSTDVVLDAGESTQLTLTWETGEGDSGNYTATVATANDSVRPDVRVNAPSSFDLNVVETNSPVNEGSVLTVAVRVEGSDSGTSSETVSLSVGGEVRDSREVTLGGGENRTVTLAWETSRDDLGEHTAVISSENASVRRPVTVVEANSPPSIEAIGVVQCDPDCDGEPTFVERSTAEWDDLTMVRGAKNDSQFVANSSDDGEIAGYEWAIDGEVVSQSRTLVHTFAGPGEYELTLTVTDDDGASTTASVTVDVNAPPTVDAIGFVPCDPECGGDPVFASSNDTTMEQEELTIAFDRFKRTKLVAPGANDSDGTVESYEWIVDGESVGSGQEHTYTFEEAGQHEVTLTVTDDDGTSTTVSSTVDVNAPPDPAFTVSGDEPVAGEAVTIEPEASDPDGTVESYEWRVDGEVVSRSRTLEHSFESSGEHRVVLAVTDDDGTERTVNRTINVAASADGGNAGPSLPPLLMGLVAVGAIGTAAYLYVRFRQRTGSGDADESSGDGGGSNEDPGLEDTHTAEVDWDDGDETESTGDGGSTQHDEFDTEDKMTEDS